MTLKEQLFNLIYPNNNFKNMKNEKLIINKSYNKKITTILESKILKKTDFLDSKTLINERIYYIINDLNEIVLCSECNEKKVKFNSFSVGHSKCCSKKCQKKWTKKKRIETNLKKYGCENTFQSSIIKEKIKKTNIERYGVDIPSKSTTIKEKTIKTNLQRYGCKSPLNNDSVKEKTIKTNIKKYGIEQKLI